MNARAEAPLLRSAGSAEDRGDAPDALHAHAAPSSDPTAALPWLIRLRGAGVRFGGVQALHGLDLALHRGDRVALVGANGSGKTTLLRLLHGLLAHDGERLLANSAGGPSVGAASGTAAGRAPTMAMLFQRPYLLHLSVRRNLLLALWLAGVPRAERGARADDALLRLGLLAFGARPA
ncbi:MAG: ATP-binding cassette domain-containing protein, partial [Leptothrix sp. (in: b-proteobacteria)]